MRRVLLLRALPAVAALSLCGAAIAAAVGPASGPPRLPDLDQEAPSQLELTTVLRDGERVHRLGFRSAVSNVGDGPLVVTGRRLPLRRPTMVADQVVERDGAPRTVHRAVGRLRYVDSPDHSHWHLLGFERYTLRPAGHDLAVAEDRKSGFCLGDRYPVLDRDLPAAPRRPRYTSRCGLEHPGMAVIEEGISVGYGDDYVANLEGQWLRLNGLPAGRYVLVHRVNGDRRLRESRYGNNAASLLLQLRWDGAEPAVRVLRVCPGSARCDRPR